MSHAALADASSAGAANSLALAPCIAPASLCAAAALLCFARSEPAAGALLDAHRFARPPWTAAAAPCAAAAAVWCGSLSLFRAFLLAAFAASDASLWADFGAS